MAYTDEEKQANQELAAQRRAAVGRGFGSLMNLINVPQEAVQSQLTGGEGYEAKIEQGALDQLPPALNWMRVLPPKAQAIVMELGLDPVNVLGSAALVKALGATAGKTLPWIVQNLRNFRPGFYSGQTGSRAASVVEGGAKGIKEGVEQIISPTGAQRLTAGQSLATKRVIDENLTKIDEIMARAKKGEEISPDELRELNRHGSKIYGQISTNVLHGEMKGIPQPLLTKWRDFHYSDITPFTKEAYTGRSVKGTSEYIDPDADKMYDMIRSTWKNVFKKPLPDDTVMAVRKIRKAGGDPYFDVTQKSHVYRGVQDILASNKGGYKSLDELDEALKGMPGYKGTGTDGVIFQFSPEGKSGYVEGGVNAIVKFLPDRRAVIRITDEQDILGVTPTGYNRLVSVFEPRVVNAVKYEKVGAETRTVAERAEEVKQLAAKSAEPKVEAAATGAAKTGTQVQHPLSKDQLRMAQEILGYDVDPDWIRYMFKMGGIPALGTTAYARQRLE